MLFLCASGFIFFVYSNDYDKKEIQIFSKIQNTALFYFHKKIKPSENFIQFSV
jgi:hypothetical protein